MWGCFWFVLIHIKYFLVFCMMDLNVPNCFQLRLGPTTKLFFMDSKWNESYNTLNVMRQDKGEEISHSIQ